MIVSGPILHMASTFHTYSYDKKQKGESNMAFMCMTLAQNPGNKWMDHPS